MFTGIIKALGTVDALRETGGDLRITVSADGIEFSEFATGESIAINGVCLTAVELAETCFSADVSRETMQVTTLSELRPGSRVNLEPALAAGDRLGGHFVTGHVDCIGRVESINTDGRSIRIAVSVPAPYRRYLARKGSVCVDGVSLTINDVSEDGFEVNIIPHTADVTIIGGYTEGSRVNIEVDLLARYMESLLAGKPPKGVSEQFLRDHGYA